MIEIGPNLCATLKLIAVALAFVGVAWAIFK